MVWSAFRRVITHEDALTAVPTAVPPRVAVTVALPEPTEVGAVQVAVYVPFPLSVVLPMLPAVAENTSVSPPVVRLLLFISRA